LPDAAELHRGYVFQEQGSAPQQQMIAIVLSNSAVASYKAALQTIQQWHGPL